MTRGKWEQGKMQGMANRNS